MVTLAGASLPDNPAASGLEMLTGLTAVVLAAGKGTRMGSSLPKVLHEVQGRPMVCYVISSLQTAGVSRIIAVVGHQAELVTPVLPPHVLYAYQREQRGTGHALMCASPLCPREGSLLVVCGDTPLLRPATLRELVEQRSATNDACVILTFMPEDPTGYGRILRDAEGRVNAIVEQRDADPQTLHIRESNSGVYCFDPSLVFRALEAVRPDNAQGEYYLTDVVRILLAQGKSVSTLMCGDPEEVTGINTPAQFAQAAAIMSRERRSE
jgi:bifunctional UDP-N-acetylglucosamine pyrophosphorylase/glucosamine-1-phosphate N-acetyltransferase